MVQNSARLYYRYDIAGGDWTEVGIEFEYPVLFHEDPETSTEIVKASVINGLYDGDSHVLILPVGEQSGTAINSFHNYEKSFRFVCRNIYPNI